MKYTIDATGKKIGRVATEAAVLLMGKNKADFQKNILPDVSVTITNASKATIDSKKKAEMTFWRHSQYRGGGTTTTLDRLIESKGYSEAFREAVWGMLPKNKLRQPMFNNLVVTE